jgi:hypothetical protein
MGPSSDNFGPLGRPRGGEGVSSLVAGRAERRKPDRPLHSEGVRRMLTVALESKKEIPAKTRCCSGGFRNQRIGIVPRCLQSFE